MVQPSDMGNGDHITLFEGMILPSFRSVHLQRLMDAVAIVVLEVFLQNPTEMGFTEDDDPVQTSSPDTAVESLGIGILPGAAVSGQNLLDPHVLDSPLEHLAVNRVAVAPSSTAWRMS